MIRPYLEIGAAMGWPPSAVRAASLADFSAALDGWLRANGVGEDGPQGAVALTDDDYRDILREIRA